MAPFCREYAHAISKTRLMDNCKNELRECSKQHYKLMCRPSKHRARTLEYYMLQTMALVVGWAETFNLSDMDFGHVLLLALVVLPGSGGRGYLSSDLSLLLRGLATHRGSRRPVAYRALSRGRIRDERDPGTV